MGRALKVALLGGGVIGAGWAGRLLINGHDVAVWDPDAGAERRVRQSVEKAVRACAGLTMAPVSARGALSFPARLEEALDGAGFVQESAPESLEIKVPLLERASSFAGPEVIIASSTSGLLPSEFQRTCSHPERVCVGHPFNPVYLMPLVEVVGGEKTSEKTKRNAAKFYADLGMHPLVVSKEIDAFIADRLMESVWREALHLVSEGVATADEVDQAMCYGPGLRWAFMGSFLTYRLGGGEGGMRHFLRQFAPTLKLPWARFDGPELDDQLLETVAQQSDMQAGGMDTDELERMRDDCLMAVLQGLRDCDRGAGAVLRRHEERLYGMSHRRAWDVGDDLSAPLELHRDRVRPEWTDYNRHMTESRYLQFFGDATDALLWYVGCDSGYHARNGSYYTVETHICHLREAHSGDELRARTLLLGYDDKRIHLMHEMLGANGEVLATAEHMMLHVDTGAALAAPAEPAVLEALGKIMEGHRDLERPARAGRSVGLRSGSR